MSIKKVITKGDRIQNKRLSDVGEKFVTKNREWTLNKKIDIAVHALKDIPSKVSKNFILIVFLKEMIREFW